MPGIQPFTPSPQFSAIQATTKRQGETPPHSLQTAPLEPLRFGSGTSTTSESTEETGKIKKLFKGIKDWFQGGVKGTKETGGAIAKSMLMGGCLAPAGLLGVTLGILLYSIPIVGPAILLGSGAVMAFGLNKLLGDPIRHLLDGIMGKKDSPT